MEEYNTKKIVINILVVLVILSGFYFLTTIILDNQDEEETITINTEIQYEEIRLSSLLEQKESEYYVLVELEEDIADVYQNLTSLKTLTELNAYTATLDNVYNEKYYVDQSDFALEKPLFSQTTLVKVINNQIEETYESVETITNYMIELSGEDDE